MKLVRRYVAPISIAVLIIVAGLTFATLRTNTISPPPILDPDFALWVENSGQSRPMIWQLQYVKSPSDLVLLNQTEASGMNATELQIIKNDHAGWTYMYLTQYVDGPRLTALFTMDVGIWVMKETGMEQAILFGVEVNDGLHMLTFIFSNQPVETKQFLAPPLGRLVYLETPANRWANQRLDFMKQYQSAKWPTPPDHITLSIVFGVGPNATGAQAVYVHGFTVLRTQLSNPAYLLGLLDSRKWSKDLTMLTVTRGR